MSANVVASPPLNLLTYLRLGLTRALLAPLFRPLGFLLLDSRRVLFRFCADLFMPFLLVMLGLPNKNMPMDLLKQNWYAAAAHLLTGISVIVMYSMYAGSRDRAALKAYRYQLSAPNTLAQCNTSNGTPPTPGQCNVEINFQKPKATTSINVIYGVVAFFFITALAHAFYGSNGFGTGSYLKNIQAGWNPYRWLEYALSASIMSVIIGLVDGTRDMMTLIVLALVTMAMMVNGYTSESLLRGRGPISSNAKDSIFGSTACAWILFAALWGTLIYSFASLVTDVSTLYNGQTDSDGEPVRVPSWIWFIVIMQFLYFGSFGWVQASQIQKRLRNDVSYSYANTEKSYIFLSYFAKLSLASGLGYGLLWRTKNCPTT